MKRLFTLFFVVSVLSATMWAADATIVENYSTVANAGIGNRNVQGELGLWQFTQVRWKADSITKGTKKYKACLLAITSNGTGQLQTTNLEGGIKSVKFDYARTGTNNINGNSMQLQVSAGDISHPSASWAKNSLTSTGYETYNETFECKSNAQLTIFNNSTETTTPLVSGTLYSKILVQNITITPYLLYRQKDITIGLNQQRYYNGELINNTGSEGSISYTSSATGVATVDENGVVTPVSAGDAVITATWSEGASTNYKLHVVSGIIAENFSKVSQTSQTASATWHGDLFDWSVANVRRGVDDTLGLSPRIQATAMRTNTGSTIISANSIEGGVKHLAFDWRQWASATSPLTFKAYYSTDKENWGDAVATQEVEAATASTPHVFDADIDNGSTGNAYLKLEYTSGAGVAVIGALKITPYLLYTTKEATLDSRYSGTFTNTDLINNTEGEVNYISSNTGVATINETTGEVTLVAPGITIITASWEGVTTTYTLYYEDVITEDFSNAPTSGVSTSRTSFDGNNFTWYYRNARSKTTDKLNSGVRGFWLSPEASGNETYLETTTEGGIKRVSFDWRQYDPVQNGYQFAMQIRKNSGTQLDELTFVGADSYVNTDQSYSKELAIKRTDSKLTIRNGSTSDGSTAGGKLIIGPITITPYLLYTDKSRHTMRIDNTYTREIINNTAGESGTLSFISSNEAVATVNGSGQVTAVASGTATITAKFAWSESEYVTTTYPVHVLPANCETFSNEATTSTYAANEESAAGDKATWTARLGGINTGDFTPYVAFIRAPRQGENKEAYLYSRPIEGGIGAMTFDWNLVSGESTTNWDIRIFINGREVKRLGDADLTKAKMAEFASITINDINEPDNFTIRFENHSTISGEYTSGNKARFVIDNISWTSYAGTKTLAEDTDNSGWIRSNGGQTRTVAISRSALVANVWNTLCLPFALEKSALGVGTEVQEMNSASLSGDELTIGFTAMAGDVLTAGRPYLVKPASNVDISGTYEDKSIAIMASPVTIGNVTLQGIYSPTPLKANDYSTLFVGVPDDEGNNLFYPSEDASLNGFRAYFKINEAMGAPIRHARFVTDQTNTATGSEEVRSETVGSVRSEKILENGQLIIIRDGVRYDVLGRKK